MTKYNYICSLSDDQEKILEEMVRDRSYWSSGHTPSDVHEALEWAIQDAIIDYVSRMVID